MLESSDIPLWQHQQEAITLLRQSIAARKKRPVLAVPTGGGKTRIAGAIINMARSKGNRVVFIVDAISLIDQTVKAFYEIGLSDIGVIQSDHVMTNWAKPIQVASVQTLQRRGMPDCQMAIVDECHVKSQWLEKTLTSDEWSHLPVIGLSATPWAKGMGLFYDNLLVPVTMKQLIADGTLLDFRVYAPAHPDLSGVETTAGDFQKDQLSEAMQPLVADIVDTWIKLGEDRPTLCYCVDRAHAKKVQERFLSVGIAADYIDMATDSFERERIQKRLESGQTKVVCNIATLTKGIDWKIGCIIIARPTKSKMLHVQIAGRVIRANSGFPDGLVLDHSDNMLRLGLPPDISHMPLCNAKKGEKKKGEQDDPLPKECPSCGFLKAPKVRTCPVCKFEPERKSDLEEEDGELVQITGKPAKEKVYTMSDKQDWWSGLLWMVEAKGYKRGWASNKYREKFGVWPKGLKDIPVIPKLELSNFIRSSQIRFAKSKAKAA